MDGLTEHAATVIIAGLVALVVVGFMALMAPAAYRTYRQIQCVERTGDLAGCRAHIK